jgi:cobalt-zinc-cadmium efflux system outer membrane protein
MSFSEMGYPWFALAFLALFLCGCSARPVADTAWPEPRSLGSDLSAYKAPLESEEATVDFSGKAETGEALTLRQALSRALMSNPELAGFSWEVRAREARTLQAGLPPNPEVEADVENFGGSKELSGLDAAETTIALSQLIELGGKRSRRERVAALERDLAGWDYEAKRLDVLTDVSKAFVDVLGAQEKLAYTRELVGLAEATRRTVAERVEAGKVSPLEVTKAGVSLSNTRIEHEKARSELAAARKKLAALWGTSSPSFEEVQGTLETLTPVPSAENLQQFVSQNPDIVRWVKETEQRTAALDLEKAKRIPDLTVKGGVRYFSETDDNAFVMGVSIPIPLFDRNQGGVLEAKVKLAKAREESRAAEAKVGASLAESYQLLSFSHEQATALKNQVLPAAEEAFNAAGEGYREGKFDFLEFLDAQRTLFEAKGSYIESLASYHKAKADVERLIGSSLDDVRETR